MTKRKRPRYLHVDALRFAVMEGRRVVVLELVDDSQLLVLLDENGVELRHAAGPAELPVCVNGSLLLAEDIKRAVRSGDVASTTRRWR